MFLRVLFNTDHKHLAVIPDRFTEIDLVCSFSSGPTTLNGTSVNGDLVKAIERIIVELCKAVFYSAVYPIVF